MNRSVSKRLYEQACKLMPGGVNSPVRSGRAVGFEPLFIKGANGCRITDEDGNVYIDYVGSWGPLILGHSHPEIIAALAGVLDRGTSYGIPTRIEIEMASKVVEMVPSIEMVRMVNSGTEAAMSAIRLARGYTGRKKIIKFNGCYHGHADSLLVKSGSGLMTFGIPGTPGVPDEIVKHTISLPYNDLETVHRAMSEVGEEVAGIIVEPVAANMGVVLPAQGYLEGLRRMCTEHGALLIFDEVITGFRLGPGGAQQYFGITPDLTCLGKIIGGGLPVGAYGGKKEIMEHIAPCGNVYQAGTLSGNPLAMSAGLAMLNVLDRDGVYEQIEKKNDYLCAGLQQAAASAGIAVTLNRIGSLGCGFFTPGPVTDLDSAAKSDTEAYALFFREMVNRGVYFAPSQFEAFFVGAAHHKEDLDLTIQAAYDALRVIKQKCGLDS